MDLYKEWEDKTKDVATSYLTMSISELINRYTKNRLKINPAYQRHYRWTNQQKSNFIESLILGYPIPPIFMYRNTKKAEMEIIDGLQRLATIFEFTGNLKPEIRPKENLKKLVRTKIMNIEGKTWKDFCDTQLDFVLESRSLQLVILDNNNHLKTKYEIFRRLNSSAVALSSQEIRNATLFEIKPEEYIKIEKTISNMDFSFLSEKDLIERKDLELFLEFMLIDDMIHNHLSDAMDRSIQENTYSEILDDYSFNLKPETLTNKFAIFQKFHKILSPYKFKNYNKSTDKYTGQFTNAYFEILSTLFLLEPKLLTKEFIQNILCVKYVDWLKEIKKTNPNAKTRLAESIEYAKKLRNKS